MTRRPMQTLLAIMLLAAIPALAGDSDSDSDSDFKHLSVLVSDLEPDRRGGLVIDGDLLELGEDIELDILALVEVRARFNDDAGVNIGARKTDSGLWRIETFTFDHSLLDGWRLVVTADKLEKATAAQVLIDGKLYLWEAELYQKLLRYRWERNCTLTMFGFTRVLSPPQFWIDTFELGPRCGLRDEEDEEV